jgi:CRISPR-associated protein Csx3
MIKEELKMPVYNIDLSGDKLKCSFGEPANNDLIIIEASAQLDRLIESGRLRGGSLLKITGRLSVPVVTAITHRVAHLFSAIAIHDPKVRTGNDDTYYVAISHSPDYQLGQIIAEPIEVSPPKIVICGPSHSGKSCLREGLKEAIRKQTGQAPYILTACPDGEGAWFYEAYSNNPDRARKLKAENISEFTSKYAEYAGNWVRDLSVPALIDCGGKISEENTQILKHATHAIVIAGDRLDKLEQPIIGSYRERLDEWVRYCSGFNLEVIAKLHSDFLGTEDRIDTEKPLTGVISHLKRGKDLEFLSDRPMIRTLAKRVSKLLDLTQL